MDKEQISYTIFFVLCLILFYLIFRYLVKFLAIGIKKLLIRLNITRDKHKTTGLFIRTVAKLFEPTFLFLILIFISSYLPLGYHFLQLLLSICILILFVWIIVIIVASIKRRVKSKNSKIDIAQTQPQSQPQIESSLPKSAVLSYSIAEKPTTNKQRKFILIIFWSLAMLFGLLITSFSGVMSAGIIISTKRWVNKFGLSFGYLVYLLIIVFVAYSLNKGGESWGYAVLWVMAILTWFIGMLLGIVLIVSFRIWQKIKQKK